MRQSSSMTTATMTPTSNIVDAVSIGTITDSLAALELPAIPAAGIAGNSEHLGANNADWIVRPTPNPQSSTSIAETRTCN